jgi:hypothetical protein
MSPRKTVWVYGSNEIAVSDWAFALAVHGQFKTAKAHSPAEIEALMSPYWAGERAPDAILLLEAAPPVLPDAPRVLLAADRAATFEAVARATRRRPGPKKGELYT